MQFRAIDGIDARGEDGLFLLEKRGEKFRRHGRFDAHARDVRLGEAHVFDHAVCAIRGPQVEAQLVQPGVRQRAQVFRVH